jgi:extradiol dioxygenase family protein
MRHPTGSGLAPFHLAFPVRDIEEARRFYGGLLQGAEGRSDSEWVDFDFFGHQLVAHRQASVPGPDPAHHNQVDGHAVPIPHFGVVLPGGTWHGLADRLRKAHVHFVIEPYIRLQGQVGEQATMFFLDPSGNALEFKAFRDPTQLFAK